MSADLTRLKSTFSSIADLYDAVRPTYPQSLIDRVLAPFANPSTLNILEVGCGSGQATQLFAPSGAQILATDLSPALIQLAKKRLAAFPNVNFLVTPFEDMPTATTYDLIYAASAFHWIPADIGIPKAARLLKPNAHLALFWNPIHYDAAPKLHKIRDTIIRHVPLFAQYPEGSDQQFDTFQIQWYTELTKSNLYQNITARIIPSTRTYTPAEYLALITSYSWYQTQPETTQHALLTELESTLSSTEQLNLPIRNLLITAER